MWTPFRKKVYSATRRFWPLYILRGPEHVFLIVTDGFGELSIRMEVDGPTMKALRLNRIGQIDLPPEAGVPRWVVRRLVQRNMARASWVRR